nr:hypothetical protein KitaXyl93_22520 [Kitasatospora sp. Xyl93]
MFIALPDTDVFTPECYRDPLFSPAEGGWANKGDLIEMCTPVMPKCVPCPHRAMCIRQTRPHPSKFDGVAGGRLWLGGEVIGTVDGVDDLDLPLPGKPRGICGSVAGHERHRVVGEQPCDPCQAAFDSPPQAEPETEPAQEQLTLAIAA